VLLIGEPVVWSTPLRTRFRGIDVRDGVLLRGSAGWGELSPFWDYDDEESSTWLRAAHEAAVVGWPEPVR
jgi:O-succinylbenzoate synthase